MKYLLLLFLAIPTFLFSQNQWKCHTIDKEGSGTDGVKLADINNDGRFDIATGWEESGVTKIYFQPETQNIKNEWPKVVIGQTPNVEDAVFADINSDGKVDIISCTENHSQKIFIHFNRNNDPLSTQNWEQNLLPASAEIMSWMYAEPLQVDHKQGIDLVAAGKGENAALGWFESPENPDNLTAWKWHEISKVGWIMSIIKEDMDNDGDIDLLISDRNGELCGCRWLENPGSSDLAKQPWTNHFIGARNLEVMFMSFHDNNGDGIKEALVSERTNNSIIIFERHKNIWREKVIKLPSKTGRAKSVEAGDMNNDGIIDIVVSTNTLNDKKDALVWLDGTHLNNTSDSDWQSISGILKAKYDKVELIDLDKDGDLDILICEENNGEKSEGLGVIWYENPTF